MQCCDIKSHLEAFWGALGRLLGRFWGASGASWGALGALFGRLGWVLGRLEAFLGALGGIFEHTWSGGVLGRGLRRGWGGWGWVSR